MILSTLVPKMLVFIVAYLRFFALRKTANDDVVFSYPWYKTKVLSISYP